MVSENRKKKKKENRKLKKQQQKSLSQTKGTPKAVMAVATVAANKVYRKGQHMPPLQHKRKQHLTVYLKKVLKNLVHYNLMLSLSRVQTKNILLTETKRT